MSEHIKYVDKVALSELALGNLISFMKKAHTSVHVVVVTTHYLNRTQNMIQALAGQAIFHRLKELSYYALTRMIPLEAILVQRALKSSALAAMDIWAMYLMMDHSRLAYDTA